MHEYYPCFIENGLEVEITLNSNDFVFDGTNVGCKYEITDAHICTTIVEPDEQIRNSIMEQYLKEGISLNFTTHLPVERPISQASDSIAQEFQESLTMLDAIHLMSRPTNFTDAKVKTYALERLVNEGMTFYYELNRVKFPEYGIDGFFNDMFYKKQQALNIFANQLFTNQSLQSFARGDDQILTVNLERYQNGELTGQNVNDLTIRLVAKNLKNNQARNLLVILTPGVCSYAERPGHGSSRLENI